jgi:hypothetical protein
MKKIFVTQNENTRKIEFVLASSEHEAEYISGGKGWKSLRSYTTKRFMEKESEIKDLWRGVK